MFLMQCSEVIYQSNFLPFSKRAKRSFAKTFTVENKFAILINYSNAIGIIYLSITNNLSRLTLWSVDASLAGERTDELKTVLIG